MTDKYDWLYPFKKLRARIN